MDNQASGCFGPFEDGLLPKRWPNGGEPEDAGSRAMSVERDRYGTVMMSAAGEN